MSYINNEMVVSDMPHSRDKTLRERHKATEVFGDNKTDNNISQIKGFIFQLYLYILLICFYLLFI
jgi:hypothetical protein